VCRCGELSQSNQLAIQVVLEHLAILEQQHRLAFKKVIELRATKLISFVPLRVPAWIMVNSDEWHATCFYPLWHVS
jgi:hypothetical protein